MSQEEIEKIMVRIRKEAFGLPGETLMSTRAFADILKPEVGVPLLKINDILEEELSEKK